MNKSISINFDNKKYVSQSSEYWLKLELVEEKDTATLGEVAELLDAIYEINPCEDKTEDSLVIEEQKSEPITLERLQELVKNQFKLNMCNANFNNDYIAKVKVFRSHKTLPYVLKFDNGEIKSTTFTQEQITENLTVENATSVTLSYTLAGNLYTTLNNYVFTTDKITTPILKIDGSTISWDVPITASITASYLTEYDLVEIAVFANEEGEMGECLVLGFYHGLVEELTLTPPDIDEDTNEIYRSKYCGTNRWEITSEDNVTCYETRTMIYKCQCSGEVAYEVTEEVNVTCPQDIRCPRGFGTTINNGVATCSVNLGFKTIEAGYIDCGETTDDINSPEFYMEYCCDYPQVTLPKCDVYYAKNPGGKTLDIDKQNEYISKYGELVEFINVSPENGDCGNIKYNQVRNRKNCCDEVLPIIYDTINSVTTLSKGTSGIIYISGGRAPFKYSVRGHSFSFDGGQDIISEDRHVRIYAGPDSCGPAWVTVSDGCSEAKGYLRSPDGSWSSVAYIINVNYWLPHWFTSGVYGGYWDNPSDLMGWLDAELFISDRTGAYPLMSDIGRPFGWGMAYNSPACYHPGGPGGEAPTRTILGHEIWLFTGALGPYPDSSGYYTSYQSEYKMIHKFSC